MSALDTTFVVVFTLIFPLYGVFGYRELIRRINAGDSDARLDAYRKTIAAQWAFVTILVVSWFVRGRSFADLGFTGAPNLGFWMGLLATAVILAGFESQRRSVLRSQRVRDQVRNAVRNLEPLLPHSRREFNWFAFVSFTAGVCEEVLYRGFLMWYLQQLGGIGLAVVGSSILFGFGHAYQGVGGFFKTGAVGLLAAGLYLLSGTILVPMLLHAGMDLLQGHMIFYAFQHSEPMEVANAEQLDLE